MTWRMRSATGADSPALSILASAAFLEAYATRMTGTDLIAHCLKYNSVDHFARWADDPATIVTLAEREPNHVPIVYTVLTRPDFPIPIDDADVELRRIYLLAQAQGTGLAQAMIAKAVADASAAGATRMLLGVWDQNHRARAFYERQGFTVIGERQFQVGAVTYDDPIYALSL